MHMESMKQAAARYRPVSIGAGTVEVCREAGGAWHLRSAEPIGAYPERMTDCLVRGAGQHPDRVLAAQRGADGQWERITYAQMLHRARAVGQALLARGLSPERPLLILSGNDLQHLQLALGAMYAGIPYCPVSPAYALVTQDYSRLAYLVRHLTPGLVYATDGALFAGAIQAVVPPETEVAIDHGEVAGRAVTRLASLLATGPADVDAANARVGPDTIAKFLLTSGSTRSPKAVTTTHRMLCSNQQMLLQTFPCFGEAPPVLLDWLPWNHTFGGSHNVGIALYNGGSYYIDSGKPTPQAFEQTLRNLRDVQPTVYFNVPKGWEMLTDALEARPRPARALLCARPAVLLCRGRAVAGRVGPARGRDRGPLRRAHPHHGRPGDDRDRAVVHVHHRPGHDGRLHRPAGARLRGQARAGRRQARSPLQGPACHAGLLARAGAGR